MLFLKHQLHMRFCYNQLNYWIQFHNLVECKRCYKQILKQIILIYIKNIVVAASPAEEQFSKLLEENRITNNDITFLAICSC